MVEEENKKKSLSKIIIIIILLILILALGGYIVYDKMFSKDKIVDINKKETKKKQTTNTTEEKSLSFNNSNVIILYDMVKQKEIFAIKDRKNYKDFTSLEMHRVAYQYLSSNDFTDTGKTIQIYGYPGRIFQMPAATYDKKIKMVFGEDVTYDKVGIEIQSCYGMCGTSDVHDINFNTSFDALKYDEATDSYQVTLDVGGCGGICGPFKSLYTYLESATEKDNEITLTERVVYVVKKSINNEGNETTGFNDSIAVERAMIYSDINYTNLIDQKECNYGDCQKNAPVIKAEDYKDKASTVKYTFKKNDKGNYYYYSNIITSP